MKLQEILKLNRAIKRKGWSTFYIPENITFSYEDIIADDWDCPPIQITPFDYYKAVDQLISEHSKYIHNPGFRALFDDLAEKLNIK